jgi:hypothetical protein
MRSSSRLSARYFSSSEAWDSRGIAGGRDDPHPRDDHAGSARAALGELLDIQMPTMQTGRERTQAEYAKLLAEEKFRLERVVETRSDVQILEVIPV